MLLMLQGMLYLETLVYISNKRFVINCLSCLQYSKWVETSCELEIKVFFPTTVLFQTKKYFKEIGIHADVKYIDPTYMIRACRANASDGILCTILGQNAVSHSSSLSLPILHRYEYYLLSLLVLVKKFISL